VTEKVRCNTGRLTKMEKIRDQSPLEISNPTVQDRLDRKQLSCSFCPPNRKENQKGRIPRADKYKNKDRQSMKFNISKEQLLDGDEPYEQLLDDEASVEEILDLLTDPPVVDRID
jgi:hypothetical protein